MNTPPDYRPPEGCDILYADEALIIVNKPAGLLSVPGSVAERADCMISRVQAVYPDALIVHRLDMSTSGLLVLARGKEIHRLLSMAFAAREVDKRYIAVADGKLEKTKGEINLPLIADWPNRPKQKVDFEVGKPSLTRYKVLSFNPELNATRVELEPVTGRSHQLRVHLLSIGHIILGDDLYAPEAIRSKAPRLLLHASDINLPHPITKERLSFHCPAPF
ncbi:MAG: hypothetical protein RLZZ422_467 [Pseudomonadota bacterium]|jgi:tRNA pseudouridine32 synthase/23S rRNA pseudouridine746 synthase